MFNNKWKIAFCIMTAMLLVVCVVVSYVIIDQGVTITHMQESYDDGVSDLNTLVELLNQSNLSKPQVEMLLKSHSKYAYMNFEKDTIKLEYLQLIFKNDSLSRVDWIQYK